MDNLPKDPPDSDPVSEAHSETASHQRRDAHGRFIPEYEQTSPPNFPNPPTTPNLPNIPNPSNPSQPQVIHTSTKPSDDGPLSQSDKLVLFEAKVNNPFSKFFNWIKKLIKNEGINIKIKPLTAIAMVVALTGGGGIIGGIVGYAFPHSSPILHREVAYQGNLQKTSNGIFLILPNSDKYTLRPKSNSTVNFQTLNSGPAFVKGNLTPENFVIEVAEIIPLGSSYITPTPHPPHPAANSANFP